MQKYFLSLMFWRCATVTPHNINDSCMTMQHSKISWDANWFVGLVLDTQLMCVNLDEACSLATRHLLNTVSFFISFVLPPLIENSAVMLCEGEPTGTAFESRPQKQRHKERLGRVCRGDWDEDWDLGSSRKHPRETQKPSLGGRGMGGREECERLWRRNEHCELTRSEGWGLGWASLQGLGHLCWPCHLREGTGWTPFHQRWPPRTWTRWAGGHWARKRLSHRCHVSGWIHAIFLKSQSCFNFMQQEKPSSWCSFSLQLFNVVSVTQFALAKIRVRPELNHPCKQHLQVTPEHPCCGEGSDLFGLLLLCLANILK